MNLAAASRTCVTGLSYCTLNSRNFGGLSQKEGWGYWDYSWPANYAIGSAKPDKVFWIETLVYSIELDRLLWAGESTTANPKNIRKFIKDLVDEAGKELRKAGLVKR